MDDRPPPAVAPGGFIMRPIIAMIAMDVIAQIAANSREDLDVHGVARTAGVAADRRRAK